jgi:hypothetical protein
MEDLGLCKKDKLYQAFLAAERLEERCVPAIGGSSQNIWTDGNKTGLWSDQGNWSLGHVPQGDEDAVFTTVSPGSGDSCLWTGGSAPLGLFMFSDYPGTVTFNAAMEIGTDGLDLEGGRISQPVAGVDLIIDGPFNWLAGMLNSSAQRNDVWANGGGTLRGSGDRTAGSNLIVSRLLSFQVTVDPMTGIGSLTFVNNTGITIQSTGIWSWTGNGNLFTEGTGIISNGGTFSFSVPNGTATCQFPIQNTSTFTVGSGTLNVTGGGNGPSVNQTGGRTILYQGTTLGVSSDLYLAAGYLYTNGNQVATINGNLDVAGGKIALGGLFPNPATGNLRLTGSGNLTIGSYGEYDANVDVGNQICSLISTSGDITLSPTSILRVTTFNIPQGGVPAGITAAILSTARGSTIFGDFDYKYLWFDDGSGGAWNTEVWDRGGPGRGFSYLVKS